MIRETLSSSAPPADTVLTVIAPRPLTVLLNVDIPFASSAFVSMYSTITILPDAGFIPRKSSPKNSSYIPVSFSCKKNTFDVGVKSIYESAYDHTSSMPVLSAAEALTRTLMVLVSILSLGIRRTDPNFLLELYT